MIKRVILPIQNVLLRGLGWLAILVASFQLAAPYILPITLDDKWVEGIVRTYYRDLKIGSVHIVWRNKGIQLIFQDVQTSKDTPQKINITRAYVGISLLKSLYHQRWVFDDLTLTAGEVDANLTDTHVEIGFLKLPINLPPTMPILIQNLNLKNVLLHLDYQDELKDIYVKKLQLHDVYNHGQLKAVLGQDEKSATWLQLVFKFSDFERGALSGSLYVKGREQKLREVIKVLSLPGLKTSGIADFEFWATLKGGSVRQSIVDITSQDVMLSRGENHYHFDDLSGRLTYQFDGKKHHWAGEKLTLNHGHEKQEMAFLLTSANLQDYDLRGSNFNVGLIHFLLQDIPRVQQVYQAFHVQPKGTIPYVQMVLDEHMLPSTVLMEGQNLEFVHDDLSFQGLNGKLLYHENKIYTQMEGNHLTLTDPNTFSGPLYFKNYKIHASYDLQRHALHMNALSDEKNMMVRLDMFFQERPLLSFNIQIPKLDVEKLHAYLPSHRMKVGLTNWLNHALLAGDLRDLQFSYLGFADGFFSKTPTPFTLKTSLNHVVLDYAPDWPRLENLNAHLNIENHQLFIEGEGEMQGAKVAKVKAMIPDMRQHPTRLAIESQITSSFERGWDVLKDAHLLTPAVYQHALWEGPASLDMNMMFTLNSEEKPQILGRIHFDDASVKLSHPNLFFDKMQGEFQFDNQKIHARALKHRWSGNPLVSDMTLGLNDEHPMSIKTSGTLAPESLPEFMGLSSNMTLESELNWLFSENIGDLKAQLSFDKITGVFNMLNPMDTDKLHIQMTRDNLANLHMNARLGQESYLEGDYDHHQQQWDLSLKSPSITGKAMLPMQGDKPWTFDIERLTLPQALGHAQTFNLPRKSMIAHVNYFDTQDIHLRDARLHLMPHEEGYIINQLSFKAPSTTFEANGFWSNQKAIHHVKLSGLIQTKDVYDFLNAIGKPSSVREAKGNIRFDLSYKGDLFTPKLATIFGEAEVELKKGYIQGVDPGFGRILSLLSVDNIERRLRMDFNDLTKKGLAFDSLQGDFQFRSGRVKTDNLALDSPNAYLQFIGEMALLTQQVKAEIIVMPNVTGTLPLAAAIAAGNPAVGAAVWLMDKMFGRKIQELTKYSYSVTGTLEAPNLKEMTRKSSNLTRR